MSARASNVMAVVEQGIREATEAGVMMLTVDDMPYVGRHVQIQGKSLLNFGGCSYLGLDQRDELREAAIAAVRRYGTQFSVSRAYLQSHLYDKLEASLSAMTGGHALVCSSTTQAHMAALPVLVEPGDVVVLDQFAHASLHAAVRLLAPVPVMQVPHGNLTVLQAKIGRLSRKFARVHYVFDGLYSMHGDFAPLERIAALLAVYPNLRLYIDDAHSTSWTGTHGRGWALAHLPDLSRVVVALSLNKAFSAAGGALVFGSEEERLRVRRCGGLLNFSGPVQPPMLGAALASAELHLRHDFVELQGALLDRIRLVGSLARELGVPLANEDLSPIFFVPCGSFDSRFDSLIPLVRALLSRGMFVCPGGFPAVSRDKQGVRFTVSLHNTLEDVKDLMGAIAAEMQALGLPMRRAGAAPATSGTYPVANPTPLDDPGGSS